MPHAPGCATIGRMDESPARREARRLQRDLDNEGVLERMIATRKAAIAPDMPYAPPYDGTDGFPDEPHGGGEYGE